MSSVRFGDPSDVQSLKGAFFTHPSPRTDSQASRSGERSMPSYGAQAELLNGRLRELQFVKPRVQPLVVQEFLVCPFLGQFTVVKDEDSVRTLHGRKPVGDHKGCTSLHELARSLPMENRGQPCSF